MYFQDQSIWIHNKYYRLMGQNKDKRKAYELLPI